MRHVDGGGAYADGCSIEGDGQYARLTDRQVVKEAGRVDVEVVGLGTGLGNRAERDVGRARVIEVQVQRGRVGAGVDLAEIQRAGGRLVVNQLGARGAAGADFKVGPGSSIFRSSMHQPVCNVAPVGPMPKRICTTAWLAAQVEMS